MKNMLIDKGISLYELGKYTESLEFFENALKYDKDNLEILQWIGSSLQRLGMYEKAKTYFEKCTEIEPKNGVCWRRQGHCWSHLKNYEKALVCFENDLKINPNLEHSLFFKGLCLFNLKRYIVALTEFEKIPKTNPNNDGLQKLVKKCNQFINDHVPIEDLESIAIAKAIEERELALDKYYQNEFNKDEEIQADDDEIG